MGKQISAWFYSISTGWVTIAAVTIFIVFTALVLPRQSSGEESSADAGSPDLSFYYSAGDLYNMAEAYGQHGRDDYIRARFTFDLVWPLVYSFFLVTSVSWIFKRIVTEGSHWRAINLLPILGMLGDYLENLATSIVMWRFPQTSLVIDWLAGVFTALKWLLIAGSFISLLVGIALLGWQFIRKDRRHNP